MLRKPYHESGSTNLTAIAVAALVGGLAGAVVGLMTAPKSGKELRQDIRNKTDHTITRVGDVTTQRKEALKQQSNDLMQKGNKLANDLQTFIQESLRLKKTTPIVINAESNAEATESLQNEPDPEAAAPYQADPCFEDIKPTP